jgi:hypothetical protein
VIAFATDVLDVLTACPDTASWHVPLAPVLAVLRLVGAPNGELPRAMIALLAHECLTT